jgi:ribonuclease D
MDFAKTINSEELNQLPLGAFEGNIHLISNYDDFYENLPDIKQAKIFGFDTETKPSFKKGVTNSVSLLQLATAEDVYLFRLNDVGLPKEVIKILSNPRVIKVGAAIHDDIKSLQELSPFTPAGFIDLQDEVRKLEFECFSLKKMAAITLGFRISKSQQLSNWDAEVLTPQQQLYAATDAWVSLMIYRQLLQNKQN